MDLITVVVPVYNVAPYLAKTLHSLCNQTYQDLEILLIDDGSTDDSLAICKEWADTDSRIRVYTQENAGVCATRNRGMELATGVYIMFLDGDDWIEPDMLAMLHNLAVSYSADVANCTLEENSVEVSNAKYEDFFTIDGIKKSSAVPADVRITHYDNQVDSGLGLLAVWGPVCKLYRRSSLGNVRFDSNYKVAEDLLFNTEVICQENFKSCATMYYPFYHYVIYPGSAMKQEFQQKYLDAMRVEAQCYDRLTAISPRFGEINLIGCSVSRAFEKYAKLSTSEQKVHKEDFKYVKKFAKAHKKALLASTDRHIRISGMLKVYVPDLYVRTLRNRY